jgi:hypothetical protein
LKNGFIEVHFKQELKPVPINKASFKVGKQDLNIPTMGIYFKRSSKQGCANKTAGPI